MGLLLVATVRGRPPSASIYGSAFKARANGEVDIKAGTTGQAGYAIRFRAAYTSTLVSARFYLQGPSTPGYGAGTGGTARFTVETDDGTASHLPTGTVLATQDYVHPDTNVGWLTTWSSPASLTAGTLYHIVVRNMDADPPTNWFSINCIYYEPVTSPRQPLFPDTDWASLYHSVSPRQWQALTTLTPICDIAYGNGIHRGQGYVENGGYGSAQAGKVGSTATTMLRELFTVTGGDRIVTGASVKLMRQTGTGTDPVVVRLYTAADALIDSFVIPAASFGTGDIAADPGCGPGLFASGTFTTPRTLSNGSTYYLRLSTAAATTYWSSLPRRGSSFGYQAGSYFGDGNAQETTNGVTWASAGNNANQQSLEFYLTVA
jgi:hypothetical protein